MCDKGKSVKSSKDINFAIYEDCIKKHKNSLLDGILRQIKWWHLALLFLLVVAIMCIVPIILTRVGMFKALSVLFDMLTHLWF